jgi:hypothetical protein
MRRHVQSRPDQADDQTGQRNKIGKEVKQKSRFKNINNHQKRNNHSQQKERKTNPYQTIRA